MKRKIVHLRVQLRVKMMQKLSSTTERLPNQILLLRSFNNLIDDIMSLIDLFKMFF